MTCAWWKNHQGPGMPH
uniref:Uncharacterized protein n=1 Tax=Anguilla anguilla TaxID=7936 RepID=A0A0E9V9L4_ANGAN